MAEELRSELQGYINRHEADHFAHAAMRHEFRNEMVADFITHGNRLNDLERWQQRIIGGVVMLTFLVGTGIVAAVLQLLHR